MTQTKFFFHVFAFIFLLLTGCTDKQSSETTKSTSSNTLKSSSSHLSSGNDDAIVAKANLLAQLYESTYKTSGTFRDDYRETAKLLLGGGAAATDQESNSATAQKDKILLFEGGVSPVKYFLDGYDSAFLAVRETASNAEKTHILNTRCSQYLIFCRLMRHYAETVRRSSSYSPTTTPSSSFCRNQLARDAKVAMSYLTTVSQKKSPSLFVERRGGGKATRGSLVQIKMFCMQGYYNGMNCDEFAFNFQLAVNIIQINLSSTSPVAAANSAATNKMVSPGQAYFEQFLAELPTASVDVKRCATTHDKEMYLEYLKRIFTIILDAWNLPPPTNMMCHDDHIKQILAKIDEINMTIRPTINCL